MFTGEYCCPVIFYVRLRVLCASAKAMSPARLQTPISFMHRHFFLSCCLATGAVLYAYATHNGLGITHDSRHYLAAARSLLHDGTLRNADGTAYTNWPPLYPVLLALARAELRHIRIGQVLVFLGILFLAHRLAVRNIRQPGLRVFFMGSVVFSTPLLLTSVFVWSEGFFVLLTLAALICFRHYQSSERAAHFWWLIIFGNLLCLQRLTGTFFVFGFAVLVFIQGKSLKKAILYSVFSLAGTAAWLFRNTFLEHSPAFRQNILVISPLQSFIGYTEAFGDWFVPVSAPFALKLAVGVLWFSGILFCQWRFRFKPSSFFFQANFLASWYLACMVLAGGEASETDRFAIPAYLFIFGGIAAGLDAAFTVLSARRVLAATLLLSVWMAYPVVRTVKNAAFWHWANAYAHIQPEWQNQK